MKRSNPSPDGEKSPKRQFTMKRSSTSPQGEAPQGRHGQTEGSGKEERPPLPRPVFRLKKRLCKLYETRTVALEKGLSYKKQHLHMDEIYANLNVVERDKLSEKMRAADAAAADGLGSGAGVEKMAHSFRGAAKKLKKVKLGNIFHIQPSMRKEMSGKSVLVMALSCAGGGKTMLFTKKAPHDWAKRRIWKSIDLLFAVELRSPKVRQAKGPMDLLGIEKYGIENADDCCEVSEYIHDNPERVCIVLDGLDETKLEDCSDFVKGLINGEHLQGIRLILTSRHSSEVMQLALDTDFHLRVEVLGFQKEEVDHYIHNVLEPQDAEKVISDLKANPQLEAMMQTPFFAAATCSLFRCGVTTLPDTLGTIFSSLILNVLHQQQKKPEDAKPYKDWKSVPESVKKSVLELGFFAFQMLIRRKLVFSEDDLKTFEVPEAARSLGLLVACDKESHSLEAEEQWRFSHLVIQECLAARHVASCNLSADDTTWLVGHLGAFAGHLNTFWLLLAAELESKSADALLSAILNPQAQPSSHQDGGQCMKGAEGHDVTHFLCASRSDIKKWAKHFSHMLSHDAVDRLATELLGHHIGLGRPSLVVEASMLPSADVHNKCDVLESLLLLWRRYVPSANTQALHDAISRFAPGTATTCFTAVPSLESPHVQFVQTTSEPLLPLSDTNEEERRRRLLFACRCFAEHVNSEHSTAPLENLEPVVEEYGLDFQQVPLTPTDCHAINSVLLHHHQSITKISLTWCGIGDEGYERLTEGLALCQDLDWLDLVGNSLSDRHASHIGTVIRSNISTLQQLFTSHNTFTSVGNTDVHQYTHLCTNLLELGIGGQGSTDAPMNLVTITRILDNCRDLEHVGLHDYMIGDDGLAQLQPLLTSLRLVVLDLRKTGLTQECAPVMNLILQQHHVSLERLDLSRNDLTDSFLPDVHHTLSQCTRLGWVWLQDMKLTSASLPVLASLLPSWPSLSKLSLERNDFSDASEGVEPFVAAIASSAALEVLGMPESEFVDPLLKAALTVSDVKVQYVKEVYYDEVEKEGEEGSGAFDELEDVHESEESSDDEIVDC